MKLEKELQHLLEKLKMAEEIFTKAAVKINNKSTAETLKEMSNRKKVFLYDIEKLLPYDSEDIQVNTLNQVRLQLEKMGIEIDSILLRLSEGEILSFCLKRQEEAISMYHNVIESGIPNEPLMALVKEQLSTSENEYDELSKRKEPYNFSTN